MPFAPWHSRLYRPSPVPYRASPFGPPVCYFSRYLSLSWLDLANTSIAHAAAFGSFLGSQVESTARKWCCRFFFWHAGTSAIPVNCRQLGHISVGDQLKLASSVADLLGCAKPGRDSGERHWFVLLLISWCTFFSVPFVRVSSMPHFCCFPC